MKKILIIFIVLIGLYTIYNIVQMNFDLLPFGNKENQAVITDKTDMIELDITGVNTTIIPENRKEMKAELKGKGEVNIDQKGDRVTVSVKGKWFDWFSFTNKRHLTVFIPEDYDRNMSIEIGSGNLNFSGKSQNRPMKLDELAVELGSGNMVLKNIEAQKFQHEGTSGNVKVDSLTAKSGSFDITSGNLDVIHYTGAIKAELSSGNFDLQMDQLNDSVDIEVSSGKVDLDLPKQADFTLNGRVSSGNITSNFPLTNQSSNNHKNINGKHGSGKHQVNLEVSSGSITIH